VRFFGCIPMRLAARIQGSSSELVPTPHTTHTIMRSTQVLFANGHAVYELVDPSGTSPNAQLSKTSMSSGSVFFNVDW